MGDKALSAVPMQPPLVKTKPTPLPDASGMEAVPKAGDGSLLGDITENTSLNKHSQAPIFSTLPREIRDQIYHLVLGGQFIHLAYGAGYERSYTIYIDGKEERDTLWYAGRGLYHSICAAEGSCKSYGRGVDLRLLRVCRQIHDECDLIVHTTNTFHVSTCTIFERFTRALTRPPLPTSIQHLRNLRLDVELVRRRHINQWIRVFVHDVDVGLRESLRLHTLHLHLKHLVEDRLEIVGFESLGLDFWVPGFLRLQQCQLKHATVEMTCFTESNGTEDLLGSNIQQDYCDRVRQKLLSPLPLVRPNPINPRKMPRN
ncbi:hypothetical protein BDR22DRAFT_968616 [Usnea florida]